MKFFLKYLIILLVCPAMITFMAGCSSSDDVMRIPEDIMGIWSPEPDTFLEFSKNNEVHTLTTYLQDGETIGRWGLDVYFYEPGYNLVIYINADNEANVYQIVSMTDKTLTWCWVDEIPVDSVDKDSVGQAIGQIINKAQEGYKLDPELYHTLVKISYDEFFKMLESLDIMYPWGDPL